MKSKFQCLVSKSTFPSFCLHTYDPKDAQDVGGKDDQQVDESEQNEGNGDVAGPVKSLVGEHHLLDCSPYLAITNKPMLTNVFHY